MEGQEGQSNKLSNSDSNAIENVECDDDTIKVSSNPVLMGAGQQLFGELKLIFFFF